MAAPKRKDVVRLNLTVDKPIKAILRQLVNERRLSSISELIEHWATGRAQAGEDVHIPPLHERAESEDHPNCLPVSPLDKVSYIARKAVRHSAARIRKHPPAP